MTMKAKAIEDIEIELVLQAMFRRYGYDFRQYALSSIKRRLHHTLQQAELRCVSEMISYILYEPEFFNRLLKNLSITVTQMFRDHQFYLEIRKTVVPILKTYPFVKIWHAGCATGEEVYSMAIILKEEGFYNRVQIYATDFNNYALEVAREGIYSLDTIKESTENYNKSGGITSFSDYYRVAYQSAKMHDHLKENIIFSHHNLVSDGVFGEMNIVLCRNVMIYFDRDLQSKVLNLLLNSLAQWGYLCVGMKENLQFSDIHHSIDVVSKKERIYRRIH